MQNSNAERLWEGGEFPHLEVIDLSSSKRLKQFPDLSTTPNLKKLLLVGCSSLVGVACSVELPKLTRVNFVGCVMMRNFPEWKNLKALEFLALNGRLSMGVKNTIRVSDEGRFDTENWDLIEFSHVEFEQLLESKNFYVHIKILQNLRPIGLVFSYCGARLGDAKILDFQSYYLNGDEVIFPLKRFLLEEGDYDLRIRPLLVEDSMTSEDWGTMIKKIQKEEGEDVDTVATNIGEKAKKKYPGYAELK